LGGEVGEEFKVSGVEDAVCLIIPVTGKKVEALAPMGDVRKGNDEEAVWGEELVKVVKELLRVEKVLDNG